MITIIDKRFNKRKIISKLTYIPNKGDIFMYSDNDISIEGVVCSVSHDIYKNTYGIAHDITITVY